MTTARYALSAFIFHAVILQLHGGDQRSGVRRVFRYLYLAFIFHTAHAAPTPGGDKLGVLRLFGYLYSAFILHTSPKPLVLTGDQVYDACSGICIAPSYFILIIQPEPFGGDQQSGVRRLFRYLHCAFIFHTLIVQPQPLVATNGAYAACLGICTPPSYFTL